MNKINYATTSECQRFYEITVNCLKDLKALGFDYPDIAYTLGFHTKTRTLGICQRVAPNEYYITLNLNYFQKDTLQAIKNTIMHELIHSLPNCMCHTGDWKKIAQYVTSKSNYTISRLGKISEEYAKVVQEHTLPVKYICSCVGCGHQFKYKKKTNFIKAYSTMGKNSEYYCPHCGCHEFNIQEVKNLITQ